MRPIYTKKVKTEKVKTGNLLSGEKSESKIIPATTSSGKCKVKKERIIPKTRVPHEGRKKTLTKNKTDTAKRQTLDL